MTPEQFVKKFYEETHIGNAIYARFDGHRIILTHNKESTQHWMDLTQEVLDNLYEYKSEIMKDMATLNFSSKKQKSENNE